MNASPFEALIEEIGAHSDELAMVKALPADEPAAEGDDDKKILEAAAEGGNADAQAEASAEVAAEDEDKDGEKAEGDEPAAAEGDKPALAKSFEVTLENGDKVEAVDGTELLKALGDRLEATEGQLATVLTGLSSMVKSQTALIQEQGALLKSQAGEIAAQAARIDALAGKGAGRKAVLSVHEKPVAGALAKSEPTGLSPKEFMAKALDAQTAGRLTGLDIAVAEHHINRGTPVPAEIVARVVG